MLCMDNSPEFISLTLAEWAEKHAVKWNLSSRISRCRTLILSALTGHTVQKYSIFICSEHWINCGKSRKNGCKNITMNPRINQWTIWHRRNIDKTINGPGSQKKHGTKTGLFTVRRYISCKKHAARWHVSATHSQLPPVLTPIVQFWSMDFVSDKLIN